MTETIIEERKDESAVELTKRLMKKEQTIRLRVTEREIKFMVYALDQVVQTADDIIRLYDLPKHSDELKAQKQIKMIGTAMIRRLSGALEGKKLHFNMKAWWQIANLLSYLEKNKRRVKTE